VDTALTASWKSGDNYAACHHAKRSECGVMCADILNTVGPGYNDIVICVTLSITLDILCYLLIVTVKHNFIPFG
jgi:hypothetical protein